MKKDFLEIGKIVGVHGIKGIMRVQPWCDDASFFCSFKRFYLNKNTELQVEFSKPHGNVMLLKVKEFDTVEQAETLRGNVLLICRDDAALPDGRHFIDELIGCNVFDNENGALLGKISDVTQNPANDIWHIVNNGKEYLHPAIDDCIISIDVEKEIAVIKPLKGIFDDEN